MSKYDEKNNLVLYVILDYIIVFSNFIYGQLAVN